MRRICLVTYDIADDKRLRRVFKTMKGYGQHLQLSVFQCDLTPQARAAMEADLDGVIQHQKDQVLIFDLGPTDSDPIKDIAVLGRPARFHTRGPVIA
ncbi:MAG: CRISPR-associated endonuclease Cas2 [Deferrisomatales bacterium]